MTRIYFESSEVLKNRYPGYSSYSKNKIVRYRGYAYQKVGSVESTHDCSWKMKYLTLTIAASVLTILLVPIAFKAYHKLISKLWKKALYWS